ncbi:jupiter microtubule associated homolog 1 isoform X2 [Hyperolius riggenbachi]|uniref:jupiter microtubule associated homolog 1 isoform X2 n=1 Tax=Hyperolius riggenbachi TaxID=752182 RepID=UPI0035A303AD
MSSTSTFLGLDPESRSSSRVLRPPGGGSNFSLSPSEQQQQQPVRRHKMASNIFGIPDDPAPASCASETEGSQGAACGDPEDPQKTCQQGDSEEVSDHMSYSATLRTEVKLQHWNPGR